MGAVARHPPGFDRSLRQRHGLVQVGTVEAGVRQVDRTVEDGDADGRVTRGAGSQLGQAGDR